MEFWLWHFSLSLYYRTVGNKFLVRHSFLQLSPKTLLDPLLTTYYDHLSGGELAVDSQDLKRDHSQMTSSGAEEGVFEGGVLAFNKHWLMNVHNLFFNHCLNDIFKILKFMIPLLLNSLIDLFNWTGQVTLVLNPRPSYSHCYKFGTIWRLFGDNSQFMNLLWPSIAV